MRLSIIIPTLKESAHIGFLIQHLKENSDQEDLEILVVDGGSKDETIAIASAAGAKTFISPISSRAIQMNLGARHASGSILYFVHADTRPPAHFDTLVHKAIQDGIPAGCFRYRFDSPSFWLRINSWFTRFDYLWCQGGDKTLFVDRDLFNSLQGFDESYMLMEEYDFIRRLRKQGKQFKTLPYTARVSSRKYDQHSWLRVQWANLIVFRKFMQGVDSATLKNIYKKWLPNTGNT